MGERMRKLIILLGLASFGVVGCGPAIATPPSTQPKPEVEPEDSFTTEDDETTPVAPPAEDAPAPDVPGADNIAFTTTSLELEVETDFSKLNFVSLLGITSSKGNQISTTYNYFGADTSFTWKNDQVLQVTAKTSEKEYTRNINITFKDKNYSDDYIYNTLEKSTARAWIKKNDGKWTSGSGYFFDFDNNNGNLYYATNHHVVYEWDGIEPIIIQPNKDGIEQNILPTLCAQIAAIDHNANTNRGVDMAVLKIIGTANGATCSTMTSKENFKNDLDKFNILKLKEMTLSNYWSNTNSATMDYYGIGWPGASATYTRVKAQRKDRDSAYGTNSGYEFAMLRINQYMGSGSSGTAFVDRNLNVIGINSQGFATSVAQGMVHSSSMFTFINSFYTVKNQAGYDGQFK